MIHDWKPFDKRDHTRRSSRSPEARDLDEDLSDDDGRPDLGHPDDETPHAVAEGKDEVTERRAKKPRKPNAPPANDIGASDHPGLGPDGGYRLTAIAANGSAESSDGGIAEALAKWAPTNGKRAAIDNMIALRRSEAGIVTAPDVFDRDPFAFNMQNGTIGLHDGELRSYRQADAITMLASVDYDPSADTRAWVQRYLGYAITGDVLEQRLGGGANGKSVLLDVVLGIVGDYGRQAPPALVLASYGERHPTEIADLEGRRLVACSEIDQGRLWNEARIKSITKPSVRGTDDGIWRRMRLMPWDVQIPQAERDRTLAARIIATEASGVLAWLVRGCLAWQRNGLGIAGATSLAVEPRRPLERAAAEHRAQHLRVVHLRDERLPDVVVEIDERVIERPAVFLAELDPDVAAVNDVALAEHSHEDREHHDGPQTEGNATTLRGCDGRPERPLIASSQALFARTVVVDRDNTADRARPLVFHRYSVIADGCSNVQHAGYRWGSRCNASLSLTSQLIPGRPERSAP